MRARTRYGFLAVLVAGILLAMLLMVHAPLLYSLEQDTFASGYHDNADVLKKQEVNSTTDMLPLMQDLLDYTGPIVVNINLKNMNQVRRDLDNFGKYRRNLNNLVVNLDMTQSEIDAFSKSSEKQRQLLSELANSSVTLDELESLRIQYRDENNPDMLVSVTIQQETIRKKMRELYGQYKNETEVTKTIGKKNNLAVSKTDESVKEVEKIVTTYENAAKNTDTPIPKFTKLSLLVIPDTGRYLDTIDFSGVYFDGTTARSRYPVSLFIDNTTMAQVTTGTDGIYHSVLRIDRISAGQHTISAVSGTTRSGERTLNVIPVNSATSLTITRVNGKPEILCTGNVVANKPVQHAPVMMITDGRNFQPLTTGNNGAFQTRIRLSPGVHRVQAQFANASYPILSSKSRIYEIDAGSDEISSIRLLEGTMNVDDISLTVSPTNATYGTVVGINGIVTGKNPGQKKIGIFLDGASYQSVQTRADGSFAGSYPVEKTKTGNHSVFIRYSEPDAEIFSESRPFIVYPTGSVTALHIESTANGTGLTCTGNVTANAHGLSKAPVELVWDDANSIQIQTNAAGSFYQSVTLPPGNHSIFARFTGKDYPVTPSRSSTYPVRIMPSQQELSLEISPASIIYKDHLIMKGTTVRPGTGADGVGIFLDNRFVMTIVPDSAGQYSGQLDIEQISPQLHTIQARSGALSSEEKQFQVLMTRSRTALTLARVGNSSIVECNGSVVASNLPGTGIIKPGSIPEVQKIIAGLGNDPLANTKRPVSFAPVSIVVNNETHVESRTDASGEFSLQIALPSGNSNVTARFMNESFPLTYSQSGTIIVNSPTTVITPAPASRISLSGIIVPVIGIMMVFLFSGGSYLYLKRRSVFIRARQKLGDQIPKADSRVSGNILPVREEEPESLVSLPSPAEQGSAGPIHALYQRILNMHGLSTAAREVYVHFTGQIAQKMNIRHHRALTPREFLKSCNKRPFESAMSSFIAIYEEIRYAGARSTEKEEEFEDSMIATDKNLGDEDH